MTQNRIRRTPGLRPGVLLLALSLACLTPGASAQVPEGQVGIRLLDVPTDRADDPRARLYIVDHLQQGEAIERRIEVSSGLAEPTKITLYAAGASVEGGEFVFFEGKNANEVSRWTSVSPATLQLAPGAEAIATVRIKVPEDAESGERYGVVWGELPIATAASGVSEVTRVGIRIYLSVGTGKEPPSDFEIETLTTSRTPQGIPQVTTLVRNTGKRALDISGKLNLSEGPGGLSAGPFPAELGTTLGIGDSAPVVIELSPELPAGPWLAQLKMRSGTVKRSAQATITFPDERGATGPTVAADTGGWSWPKVAGGILFGLVLLGLFLILWRRRRKDDEDPLLDQAARQP